MVTRVLSKSTEAHGLLKQMAEGIVHYVQTTQPPRGTEIVISRVDLIAGPRTGAIEIHAGMGTGELYKRLSSSDAALARQFVTWAFQGDVWVYLSGRALRIEAAWPREVATTDIKLSTLPQRPRGGGRWVAGQNELGATVVLTVGDRTPHWLFSGTTGSGKTVALRSAVWQLSQDDENQLILIDGKMGEGLSPVSYMPRLVGPMITNADMVEAEAALLWARDEMQRRYTLGRAAILQIPRLIIVIDEFQEFTLSSPQMVEMVRQIAAQGRAARIHLIMATQQPTADIFKDRTIRTNLVGRVALKTTHAEASRAAVGQPTPRADWLLGQGDSFCIAPGVVQRVQLAYVTDGELLSDSLDDPPYEVEDWVASKSLPEDPIGFTAEQIAIGVVSSLEGLGPRRTAQLLSTTMGKTRLKRLRTTGDTILQFLRDQGYHLLAND